MRKVLCGYEQGARYGNPKVQLVSAMMGTTNADWTDPAHGAELAKTQVAQGGDVIVAAACTTGRGVLQAADDLNILGIGVVSNQNDLHPGYILTSMLRPTHVAVEQAFRGIKPGITALALREDRLYLAYDENNAALMTTQMRRRVEAAKLEVIAGRSKVIDYTAANSYR